MFSKIKMFEKTFTQIESFQNEFTVTYYLTLEDNYYGIELEQISKSDCLVQSKIKISNDKSLVEDILTFVYENTIPIETFDDVLDELLNLRQ